MINQNSLTGLAMFEGHNIRKVRFQDEWWFAIVDIVAALTESTAPQGYWRKLKFQLREEGSQIIDRIQALKLPSNANGKYYAIDSARLHDVIRITLLLSSISRRERKSAPSEAGIYTIQNTSTGECYIGSSINIPVRWKQHRAELDKGTHSSSILQEAWNRGGSDAFTWGILQLVEDITALEEIEQHYIDTWKPVYNNRADAVNMLSLKPIANEKMQRFIAFLLEMAYSTDNVFIRGIITGIRYGLIAPGPEFHLLDKIAAKNLEAWDEINQIFVS